MSTAVMEILCTVTNSKDERCGKEITFGPANSTVCGAHAQRMKQHGTYDADRAIRAYTKSGANRVRPLIPGDTPVEKFWHQVEKLSNGHWRWLGATFQGREAGMHRYANNRTVTAARFSWELVNGKAPEGTRARVACGQPGCVNPAHVELVGGTAMEVAA